MYPPSNNAQNDRLGAVSDDKKQKRRLKPLPKIAQSKLRPITLTLTSQEHVELGLGRVTSVPKSMEEGPVFSAGMSSIRRVVEALATQLEANRLATKRKIGPSREDEVYYSPRKRVRRESSEEDSEESEDKTQGTSRATSTVLADDNSSPETGARSAPTLDKASAHPSHPLEESPQQSGTNKGQTSFSSSVSDGNCTDSLAAAALHSEAEVAPSFELSEKDKQRLLQLAASKDTTGARSLIPDADSILVIKASEGDDDGAEKVQGFLRQHPYKIQNAEARTELHVCRMRVWIEGGRVEQDELPCYLSNRVPRSVFTTHDNVVRHHKTVHFKIPRAEQEKDEEGNKIAKAARGKGKRAKDHDDADYKGDSGP